MNFVCNWVNNTQFICTKVDVENFTIKPKNFQIEAFNNNAYDTIESFIACPEGGCARCQPNDTECKHNKNNLKNCTPNSQK